jgi:hypothetical protein
MADENAMTGLETRGSIEVLQKWAKPSVVLSDL